MYLHSQCSHLLLQEQPGILAFQGGQLSLQVLVMVLEQECTALAEEALADVT